MPCASLNHVKQDFGSISNSEYTSELVLSKGLSLVFTTPDIRLRPGIRNLM